jgi:adenylate cyclase
MEQHGRFERRLMAILAADVAGYSRLVGIDEEGTIARLQALRTELVEPTIGAHHGRLVKTSGDGFLVEFGSAVDAVRCALDIQAGTEQREAPVAPAQRLLLRIGIQLGDVVLEGDDILGDGVNVAARLEGVAEPGTIVVSQSVREQVEGRVSAGFADLGAVTLKNIDRPVQVARLVPGARLVPRRPDSRRRRRGLVAAASLAFMAAAAAGLALWTPPWREAPSSQRTAIHASWPVVAVLPFANLSADPAQDYFSDGITEDVITALGRFGELTVLARGAVMQFKGKALSPEELGRRLKARYLVEGSVRRTPDRIRFSIQLSDAARGRLLWSDQFDGEPKDLFSLQEQVARRIAGTLAVRVRRLEQIRSVTKGPGNLDAYDLVLRGRAQLAKVTRRGNVEARRLFEEAIRLDPENAAAYVGLGIGYRDLAAYGWTEVPGDAMAKAEAAARKAVALDPQSSGAYALLGRILSAYLQHEQAAAAARRAIALNPSDPDGHGILGAVALWTGKIDEAIVALETAQGLDPDLSTERMLALAIAYYLTDRNADSLRTSERLLMRNENIGFAHATAALAYAQLGREAEARAAVARAKQLLPYLDANSLGSQLRQQVHREKLIAGFRKAGLE